MSLQKNYILVILVADVSMQRIKCQGWIQNFKKEGDAKFYLRIHFHYVAKQWKNFYATIVSGVF